MLARAIYNQGMERNKLVLLEVYGGGFFLARRTETGQFAPLGVERKIDKPLKLKPEMLGHLRNVAAWVAFELKEQNPSKFGDIATDPSSIAEGKPSDSLKVILGAKRDEEKLTHLSDLLAREFGNPVIDKKDQEILQQSVLSVLQRLADIAYKK